MREYGIPKVLTSRWTPFAALVLGSLSFVAFAMLVIPDHIGSGTTESAPHSLGFGASALGNTLTRSQIGSTPDGNWGSDGSTNTNSEPNPVSHVAINTGAQTFPRRGFTPPLDRPDQPQPVAAPPPAPDAPVAPPPPPPPELINAPPPPPDAPPAQPQPQPDQAQPTPPAPPPSD
jgi:hypothetical protein